MKVRRALLKDLATVETFSGSGAYGPVYAAAVTVRCGADVTSQLVQSSTGDSTARVTTLVLHPATEQVDPATGAVLGLVDPLQVLTVGSRVTVAAVTGVVTSLAARTGRGGTTAYVEASVS